MIKTVNFCAYLIIKKWENVPLEIEISSNGIKKIAASTLGMAESSNTVVNRQGGGGYA